MDDHHGARFVPVAKIGDPATARVIAARLEAEGIEVRLHSEAFGPYPVTVGNMAQTELWVLHDRVEEASRILLDAEVVESLAERKQPDPGQAPYLELKIVAAVMIVVFSLMVVLRLMRVF